MSTNALYEGMFIVNIAEVGNDPAKACEIVQEVLNRAEAETVCISKWEERKMAYPMDRQKRGVYVLTYFRVKGALIANIERDVNLSETILRCLITRADHMGEVEINQAIENAKAANSVEAAGNVEAKEEPAAAE